MKGLSLGNEPPWPNRESELVDMFLKGPDTPPGESSGNIWLWETPPSAARNSFMACSRDI